MKEKSFLQIDAYSYIKDKILSGSFLPDTMYSETKLSAELGISRTPVREALQCLSQDGYITIIPSRGFKIQIPDEGEMKQTMQERCAIEGYCAFKLCTEIKTPKAQKLIARLQKLLNEMEELQYADDERNSFFTADLNFHLTLIEYAENEEFNHFFQRVMYIIGFASKRTLNQPGRAEETLNEHHRILDALCAGNFEKVYSLIYEHVMATVRLSQRKPKAYDDNYDLKN